MSRSARRPRPSHLVSFLFLLCTGVPPRASAQTELWRHTTTQDIKLLALTPYGSLLVGSDTMVVALDPVTGRAIWQYRPQPSLVPTLSVPGFTGLATLNGVVLDLATGVERWRMRDLTGTAWREYRPVAERGLVLALMEAPDSGLALVAADLATGRVVFRHDSLFADLDVRLRRSVNLAWAAPLFDSDTTVVLWFGVVPPLRLHARTGQLLWRADSTWPSNTQNLGVRIADMLLAGGRVFVPDGHRLLALDAATGRVLWGRDRNLPSPLAQMELTTRGLLIRGSRFGDRNLAPFLDLLDPATGASRWPRAYRRNLGDTSPFFVRGDSVYLPAKGKLFALALATCVESDVASMPFEGNEEPVDIEPRSEGLLLRSGQNLTLVGDSGVRYHRYYRTVTSTNWLGWMARSVLTAALNTAAENLARSGVNTPRPYMPVMDNPLLTTRYQATVNATEFAFIFTSAPDSSGRRGFSLVRVRKADGRETGRIWVTDRKPEFVLDPATNTVFLREGPREVTARRF